MKRGLMPYTAADKFKAVERELALRLRVYPNRVLTGRMSQAEADRQIAIMREILVDYAKAEEGERLL